MLPQLSFAEAGDRGVQRIACGGNHTVLLLSDGSAHGCGDNSSGQLFDGSRIGDCASWTPLDQHLKDIACGWDFTVGINEHNEVVSRGSGPKGELGIEGMKQADHFVEVMKVAPKSRVFASLQNCVVVEPMADNGGCRVYGWGSNTKCQLREPKSRIVATPVTLFESDTTAVEYAALGKDFTVLVDTQGRIAHASGNLPPGFDLDQWTGRPGLQVHCMWTSLHIVSAQHGIHSYGNGRHGQLFDRVLWQLPTDLRQVALGSEHGVLLSGTSRVACWGWGEHGNCGRLTDDTAVENDYSNAVSPLNYLPLPNRVVTGIFAGCATTWIVAKG